MQALIYSFTVLQLCCKQQDPQCSWWWYWCSLNFIPATGPPSTKAISSELPLVLLPVFWMFVEEERTRGGNLSSSVPSSTPGRIASQRVLYVTLFGACWLPTIKPWHYLRARAKFGGDRDHWGEDEATSIPLPLSYHPPYSIWFENGEDHYSLKAGPLPWNKTVKSSPQWWLRVEKNSIC